MLLEGFSRAEGCPLNGDCDNCHNFDMDGNSGEPLCHAFRSIGEHSREFELYMLFGDRPRCPLQVRDHYFSEVTKSDQ